MRSEEIKYKIQKLASLSSPEEAGAIAKTTLEVLRLWLTPDMAEKLASTLPEKMGESLRGRREKAQPGRSLTNFFDTVAELRGSEPKDIVRPVRAVCEMVKECISPSLQDELFRELPQEFHQLFEAGPPGGGTSEINHTSP